MSLDFCKRTSWHYHVTDNFEIVQEELETEQNGPHSMD